MKADGFAWFHPDGRGDGACDDDFTGAKSFAKVREKIRDVADDGDEFSGQGFEVGSAGHFRAVAKDTRVQTRQGAACVCCVATAENYLALVDIASQGALDIVGRVIDIRDFDGCAEACNCIHGRFTIGAGMQIFSEVDGEFGFGGRFFPTRKRNR